MIVALGAFDGFHRAHRRLFHFAEKMAYECDADWGIITFENHPQTYLSSEQFEQLFLEDERKLLGHYWGIPNFFSLSFDSEVAQMSPTGFLEYLSKMFSIKGIVVGNDFRFGIERTGTPQMLQELCGARGWACKIVDLICDENQILSSTQIRDYIRRGRMIEASKLLGHPYFFSGCVVHGDSRGRTIGFPTANVDIASNKVYPPDGVYSAYVFTEIGSTIGATNIGHNPTFGGVEPIRFETHLLDWSRDLYGKKIYVFLLDYVRGERFFNSAKDLCEHMRRDVGISRTIGTKFLQRKVAQIARFEKIFFNQGM